MQVDVLPTHGSQQASWEPAAALLTGCFPGQLCTSDLYDLMRWLAAGRCGKAAPQPCPRPALPLPQVPRPRGPLYQRHGATRHLHPEQRSASIQHQRVAVLELHAAGEWKTTSRSHTLTGRFACATRISWLLSERHQAACGSGGADTLLAPTILTASDRSPCTNRSQMCRFCRESCGHLAGSQRQRRCKP